MDRIAFVCVGNAGRSQMATAFAERERERHGLDIDIVTGGTDPEERVHGPVVDALREVDLDVGDRAPRRITPEDVRSADLVVTMGCDIGDLRPPDWEGTVEAWDIDDPAGAGADAAGVRSQRDAIGSRVERLFERLRRG